MQCFKNIDFFINDKVKVSDNKIITNFDFVIHLVSSSKPFQIFKKKKSIKFLVFYIQKEKPSAKRKKSSEISEDQINCNVEEIPDNCVKGSSSKKQASSKFKKNPGKNFNIFHLPSKDLTTRCFFTVTKIFMHNIELYSMK